VRFDEPWWLAVGAVVCLALAGLWYRYDALARAALATFVSPHLSRQLTRSVSFGRRRARRALYLAAVACLCAALAQPKVGYRWEQLSRRGYDIVFAIDTSRSMLTPDVVPDRLTRAKLAIDDFAGQLDGDAAGIVAFAGRAFLVCPVTLDYGAFHESLGAIDTNTIPRGGTNISSAIRAAQAALERRPGSDKVLILVTDGEDLEGDALAAARAAASRDGLKIYTVGVGTAAGELIPAARDQGGGFVRDDAGVLVKSRLDETALKAIAAATGATYAPLGAQGEGLQEIYRAVFGSVAKHDLAFRRRKVYIDRYQWPLAASFVLLLASLLVGTRRRREPDAARATARAAMTMAVLSWITTWPLGVARAAGADPTTDEEKGAAAYRSGQFPQAAQAFKQSISTMPSSDARRLANQQDAYYDLGNALYRLGQMTEKSDPGKTIERWTQAVTAYDTALQLRPGDADSKYNRDLVKRKIEALRRPPPPPSRGGGAGGSPPPPGAPPPGAPPPGAPPSGAAPPRSGAAPPRGGAPPSQAPPGAPPPAAPAAAPRSQMSPEEARELLDSEKGDERHPLAVPMAQRDRDQPPEKPYKNW
jgi:Ca-activated chloride channel family protein